MRPATTSARISSKYRRDSRVATCRGRTAIFSRLRKASKEGMQRSAELGSGWIIGSILSRQYHTLTTNGARPLTDP